MALGSANPSPTRSMSMNSMRFSRQKAPYKVIKLRYHHTRRVSFTSKITLVQDCELMSWIPAAAVGQDYASRIRAQRGLTRSSSGSLARARLNSRIEICHVYRSAVTNSNGLVASVQHRSLLSNTEPYNSPSSCEVNS